MKSALFLLSIVCLSAAFDSDSSEEYPKPQKGKKMKKFNKMVGGEMGPPPFGMGPMGPPMGPFGFGPFGIGPNPFMGPNGPEGPSPFPPMKFKGKFKGGKRGPPMLPFLQNVSEDARRQISIIMGDPNMAIEEKDTRIEELLRNESPEAQEAFAKFKTEMAARRTEMEQRLSELREKLSPAAKEADEALTKILKDTALSPSERREQIREMFTTLPMEIQKELKELRRGMGNKVALKIREVGEFIGDVRMSLMDAFRSALGVGQRGQPEIRRSPPMRRLKFPEPAVQLETKPIAISDDEKFVEF